MQAAARGAGRDVPHTVGPRREGDPPVLVADPDLARSTLSWTLKYPDLESMIAHAWAWMNR
jgi:UDP-glucose 4-epimerase